MKIDWYTLLRDIVIVVLLGTMGTLAIGAVLGGLTHFGQLGVAVSMLTVGFTISGCLKGAGRFLHLALVAFGVWLVVLVDGWVRAPERLPSIVVGLLIVLAAMLVGGVLSLAIRRSPPAPTPTGD